MSAGAAARTWRGFVLDPFQVQALEAIDAGQSVIVAAPTGAGKTLIAEYAIEEALARGQRAIYTSPIKALSNQKYRDFHARHGDRVGIVTGDVSLSPDAPILIMTTEIFRNAIIEEGSRYADVRYCILDEVHYIDDQERGTVWEESLIFAPPALRFIALSATIPNVAEVARWIEEVRGTKVAVIVEQHRPVPLKYYFYTQRRGVFPLTQLQKGFPGAQKYSPERTRRAAAGIVERCIRAGDLPCLYFAFNRRECEALASRFRGQALLAAPEERLVAERVADLARRYGVESHLTGGRLRELWGAGVAYHHAGMLPAVKEIVERLFTLGLVKLLFATETFALGINMPARAVVFDALEKFDGVDVRPIRCLEFQQMAGRAGRRGMDEAGTVVCNLESIERLSYRGLRHILSGRVEPITSQLNLSYGTILNLVQRVGEGIYEVVDRSLGLYLARHGAAPGGRPGATDRRLRAQLERKLALLRRLGYLDGGDNLTSRGRFAARVNGFELPLTELVFEGVLEDLAPEDLAVVMASLVYEGKKNVWFSERHHDRVGPLAKRVQRTVRRVREAEAEQGIADLVRPPDFHPASVILAWSRGEPLAEVAHLSTLPDGDLIRILRLAVQLLRTVKHACKGHASLEERLAESISRIKRDEADAESQLRVT